MRDAMSSAPPPHGNVTAPKGTGLASLSSAKRAAPASAAAAAAPSNAAVYAASPSGKEGRRRRERKRDASAAYLPRRLFGITRGGIASSYASLQEGFGAPDSPEISAGARGLDPIIEGDEGGTATHSLYFRLFGWFIMGGSGSRRRNNGREILNRRRIPSFLMPYVRTASLLWGLACILIAIAHSRSFPWEVEAAWCVTCIVSFLNEVLSHQLLQVVAAAGMKR